MKYLMAVSIGENNMCHSMKYLLCGVFSLAIVQTVQAAEQDHSMHMTGMAMAETEAAPVQQAINASGVVKDIDLVNKKITIAHGEIPELGWPAMTMRFTFTTQDDSINALAVGAAVHFSFVQQGNISLLQSITVVKP